MLPAVSLFISLTVGVAHLIEYRPFRNGDPPAIAEIWRSHDQLRGLAQPMSTSLFDQVVLSKPYFNRYGLTVAEDAGKVVGFAHGGFGPNEDFSDLCTDAGVTCMVMVSPRKDRDAIADALLSHTEQFLRRQGAGVLYGGGMFPLNPFYLGIYGGSELPGVLASHQDLVSLLGRGGYRESERCISLQLELSSFRPIVDRRQIQVRRAYKIEATFDPPMANWWEACTSAPAERTRFEVFPCDNRTSCGQVTIWNMDSFSVGWGVHAVGLIDLRIAEDQQRKGLATHLTSEALRQLRSNGVGVVQVQVMQRNKAARGLYEKLGFREVDQGIVFRKDANG